MSSMQASAAPEGSAAPEKPEIAPVGSCSSAGAAVILFAHGSRDPNWAAPFREIQASVARAKPGVRVELAFLELTEPSLAQVADSVLAAGCLSLVVVPLFMGQGAHLRRDLAELLEDIRRQHPHVRVKTLPALGESPEVLAAISKWVVQHA